MTTLSDIAAAADLANIKTASAHPRELCIVLEMIDAIAFESEPLDWCWRVRQSTGHGLESLLKLVGDADVLSSFLESVGAHLSVPLPTLEEPAFFCPEHALPQCGVNLRTLEACGTSRLSQPSEPNDSNELPSLNAPTGVGLDTAKLRREEAAE